MEQKSEEMKMTYSSVISNDGQPCVSVRFDRDGDFAECIVPGGTILQSEGFTEEERAGLIGYLKMNQKEIIQMSKKISGIRNWFS